MPFDLNDFPHPPDGLSSQSDRETSQQVVEGHDWTHLPTVEVGGYPDTRAEVDGIAATPTKKLLKVGPRTSPPAILPSFSVPLATPPATSRPYGPGRGIIPAGKADRVGNRITLNVGDRKAITAAIEEIMLRSGLGTSDIARQLGINRQSIGQYKWGKRNNPTIEWMIRLVHICGGKIVIEFP